MSNKSGKAESGEFKSFNELSVVDGKLQKELTEADKFQKSIQDNIPEKIIDEGVVIESDIEESFEETTVSGVEMLKKQALRNKKAAFLKKVKESDEKFERESSVKVETPKKEKTLKSAVDIAMERTDSEVVVENEPVVKYKRTKSERKAPEDVDRRVGGLDQVRKATEMVDEVNVVEKPAPKKSTKLKSAVELAMERTNPEVEILDEEVVIEEAPKKEKTLKSSVELAMAETDSIAQEYNEKKLKKEDIESAQTLDELLAHIDASEGLQGTQDYFDEGQLRMIIEEVRDKKLSYDYITRRGGLRQKVFDLLENQSQVEEVPVENKSTIESEVVVENEPVVEEVKAEEKLVKVKENIKSEAVVKPEPDDFDSIEARYAEEEIVKNRESMVQAHRDWEALNKKVNNPFRKFFLNGLGIGLEKHNEKLAGFEKIRLEYQNKIDELVELKSTVRFNEIAELHDNNPEKRKYSSVLYSDLMPYLKDKPQAVTDYLQELSKHDDISLSELRKIKAFKKEELQEIVNKVILKKIKDEIRSELSLKENEMIEKLLAD